MYKHRHRHSHRCGAEEPKNLFCSNSSSSDMHSFGLLIISQPVRTVFRCSNNTCSVSVCISGLVVFLRSFVCSLKPYFLFFCCLLLIECGCYGMCTMYTIKVHGKVVKKLSMHYHLARTENIVFRLICKSA